jgi:hypothetical protein
MAGETVSHVFTHFSLTMDVALAETNGAGSPESWHPVRPARLPTLMRKVWKIAHRHL